MSEGDKDVLLHSGGVIEIEAVAIAEIIFQTCHCSTNRCTQAADLIIDYVRNKVMASGQAEDITKPEGPTQ
jgi:hypothetical protein